MIRYRNPLPVLAVVALTVAGCTSSTPPVGPTVRSNRAPTTATVSPLLIQLDALPTVPGAALSAQRVTDHRATRSYVLRAATPICHQLLSRLAAAGFQVVTGRVPALVQPTGCSPATSGSTDGANGGHGSILAAGGSQIALSWTPTTYTVSVSG